MLPPRAGTRAQDHAPYPAAWRAPRVVRAHASIAVIAFTDDVGPRVALVSSEASPRAATALDRTATAHERAAGPHVAPPIARSALEDGAPYLVLACDAVADVEDLVPAMIAGGGKTPYAAAAGFHEVLLDVLERAQGAGVEPLGAIGWGNVLVGPTGEAWFFGLGENFPARDATGALVGRAGIAFAPEVALGLAPTAASDVYALHVLARALLAYVELPAPFGSALEGSDPALRDALLTLSADCTSPDPAARPASVAALRARYSHICTLDPRIPLPDARAFRSVAARAVAALGRTRPRLRLDPTRRTAWLDGTAIDLSRRSGPWHLLLALVHARRAHPGVPVTTEALERAGWPDESLVGDSGRARVYVALHALRKLGMREALERRDDGYVLLVDAEIAE